MADPRTCIPRCSATRSLIGKTLAASKASSDSRRMAYCKCDSYVCTDVHHMYLALDVYTRTHADIHKHTTHTYHPFFGTRAPTP